MQNPHHKDAKTSHIDNDEFNPCSQLALRARAGAATDQKMATFLPPESPWTRRSLFRRSRFEQNATWYITAQNAHAHSLTRTQNKNRECNNFANERYDISRRKIRTIDLLEINFKKCTLKLANIFFRDFYFHVNDARRGLRNNFRRYCLQSVHTEISLHCRNSAIFAASPLSTSFPVALKYFFNFFWWKGVGNTAHKRKIQANQNQVVKCSA